MANFFSFFEFPKGFPHDLYAEILDTKGKLLTELHDIFPENNRYSKPQAYQNWEDTARLKIKFLISRFEDNKFLKPELSEQIKDISQLLIQKIENYHRTIFPKIDIFPFLNFVEEQLAKIKIEQVPKESDIAFIQGGEISFETFTDSNTNNKKGYFKIEKNNELRKYDPVQYLGLIKKGHYELADKTVGFRGKMSLFKNAELLIKQCVREYDLNKIECDFSKVFEDLKDQMEYLKTNKELGFIGDEDIKPKESIKTKPKSEDNNYSQRQIAIAYCIMGKSITTENASQILNTYSKTTSTDKFLTKRIYNVSNLTKLSGNKSTDTKFLKDLQAAERLVSGMKVKNATTDISRIITAFETAYNSKY